MITISAIQGALYIARAVVALWVVSIGMCESKKLWPFLPMVVLSAVFCGYATLFFYASLEEVWQMSLALIAFLAHVWLLGVLLFFINTQGVGKKNDPASSLGSNEQGWGSVVH